MRAARKRILPLPATFHVKGDEVEISRKCQITDETFVFRVPTEAYNRWRKGAHVQDVFPMLSADQREVLISGYTPEEWKAIFK